MVDELAKFYAVDERQGLPGRPLDGGGPARPDGADRPGAVRGDGALGGGGSVRRPEAVKGLPVFVGCGGDDFALGGAKSLTQALHKAGATRATFKDTQQWNILMVQGAEGRIRVL